jgi:hypothetical protein
LIISYLIGRRRLGGATRFVNDIADRITTMPLFVSDELAHYATALSERFHTAVPVPLTGKRGRPKNPLVVLDPNLMYATVHKTRKECKICKIETKVVFGDPKNIDSAFVNSPSKKINTAYIERSNLNWRNWDAHLIRKSPKFAKSIEFLNAKMVINILFYKFIRPHSSISKIFDNKNKKQYIFLLRQPWSPVSLLAP